MVGRPPPGNSFAQDCVLCILELLDSIVVYSSCDTLHLWHSVCFHQSEVPPISDLRGMPRSTGYLFHFDSMIRSLPVNMALSSRITHIFVVGSGAGETQRGTQVCVLF